MPQKVFTHATSPAFNFHFWKTQKCPSLSKSIYSFYSFTNFTIIYTSSVKFRSRRLNYGLVSSKIRPTTSDVTRSCKNRLKINRFKAKLFHTSVFLSLTRSTHKRTHQTPADTTKSFQAPFFTAVRILWARTLFDNPSPVLNL